MLTQNTKMLTLKPILRQIIWFENPKIKKITHFDLKTNILTSKHQNIDNFLT